MKIINILILFLILTIPVSATIEIRKDTDFILGNGATITLKSGEIFDSPIILNQSIYSLILNGNTSQVIFSTVSNKTISNWSYNYTLDKMSFDVNGISDSLNITATMRRSGVDYNLTNEGNYYSNNESDVNKVVILNFSNWIVNDHSLVIQVNYSSINFYSISGNVTNILEAPIVLARVDITGQHTFTDANGHYILPNLEDGNYSVLFRQIGYRNETRTLYLNASTILNVTLLANSVGGGGGSITSNDYSPAIVLIFLVAIMIFSTFRKEKKKKEEE